ncbi:hypothetical protein NKDENANG_01834 [Candidatus Entotheonellaceae bacterium PAL068K]
METPGDILDRVREVNEYFFAQDWSDGLPVIPPTPEGVTWMLQGTQRHRHDIIGRLPPAWGKATVERIAINGLMAGCKPSYMPVLIAAIQAISDERYGLQGSQGTTDCIAPLLIINGPLVETLGFNSAAGCFGHGVRANATVGRAICLMLLTLGGAMPGKIKKSTLSQPGTYSYCMAEQASASPWEPLHVERGFAPQVSTVTAMAATPMSQVSEHCNATATGILTTLCDSMAVLGNCNLYRGGQSVVTFPPELAAVFQHQGWSKPDVKQYVHEHACRTIGEMKRGGEWNDETLAHFPPHIDRTDDAATVSAVRDPDDLLVVVAGGEAGRWMALIPGWAYTSQAVTVPIGT